MIWWSLGSINRFLWKPLSDSFGKHFPAGPEKMSEEKMVRREREKERGRMGENVRERDKGRKRVPVTIKTFQWQHRKTLARYKVH